MAVRWREDGEENGAVVVEEIMLGASKRWEVRWLAGEEALGAQRTMSGGGEVAEKEGIGAVEAKEIVLGA
ncbi:hypothetical protein E2562_032806 [Oryza meyeriana var. granulata]|uniref:Uncharacterized protein n=1 Tax=Oryza meyeriana var. granulata TaxID=110450 RepID=A0A6G1DQV1_9ORYZ|nr:hypothetical protein E2562_032806 [Oryza meyeriana var. granulata]